MKSWLRLPYRIAARGAELLVAATPRGRASERRSKFTRGLAARHGLLDRYRAWSSTSRDPERPLIWVHAASVGEGLMALPVLERIRRAFPRVQIAFTFFSPSAESFARDMGPALADFADYLPFDSTTRVRAALEALRPTALVFAKTDVWPTLVRECVLRDVPVGLISASMPEQSRRVSGIGTMLTRDAYGALTLIGAASDDDAHALVRAGAHAGRIRVTGDTRYDQAWNRAHTARRNQPVVDSLRSDRPTIVAGSTWGVDEQVLMPAFEHLRQHVPDARLIIAPHELHTSQIEALEAGARRAGLRVARLYSPDAPSADVVIVDRVGILADLYAVATVAYVGGGFHSAGLHSLVEPAVFRVPTIIGPQHASSRDARLMLVAGGVMVADTATSMTNALQQIVTDAQYRSSMSEAMGDVVSRELGAADRSFEVVRDLLGPV